jgi:hypothetical protein
MHSTNTEQPAANTRDVEEPTLTADQVMRELQVRALYLARVLSHYCDPADPLYPRAREDYWIVRSAVAMIDRFAAMAEAVYVTEAAA